jgi:maltose-binding protein MalE
VARSRASRFAVVGVAAALVLGLTSACGKSSTSGSSSSAPGSQELTYWSMWKQGEPQQIALAASIKQFTDATGIKVTVQWQGRDVLTKLQPTLATHPAADLFDRNLAQVKSLMIPAGTATDLSEVLGMKVTGEDKTVGDVVPPEYRKLGQAGGKQVILPYQLVAASIWYDAARFPDLATHAPATWDAFQKLLDDRKAAGDTPLAQDGDIGDYNAYWYTSRVVGKLGPGSFSKAAGDKTGATWDQPGYLEAAQQIEKLAKGGYFAAGYDSSKFPALQQKWANDKADYIVMGSWLPSEIKKYAAPGLTPRSFPIPGESAASPVPSSVYGWVIPAKAAHKSAAEKLVAFLFGRQQMQAFADSTSTLSARPDVAPQPAVADAAAAMKANGTYEAQDAANEDYADWWTKVFKPLDDKLITGKIGAADFVAQLKAGSVDYWARNQ